MKQIQKPSSTAMQLCGVQKRVPGERYRLTKHCIEARCEDGTLLYNTMTCAMVLLEPGEVLWTQDALYEQRFLVPEGFDENKLVRDMRRIGAMILPKRKEKTSFSILTTTDCNARCFYCYEAGCTRTPMTEQTAHDVAAYIARACGGKDVWLHWFGGEPLFNRRAIEIIVADLTERGIGFQSSMISNGYYLDQKTAETAARDWKLKRVQITLDGTKDTYNRTKAYIERDADAFDRVIRNIGYALDEGIAVRVRLNMDERNAEDLFRLADVLAERIGKRDGFGVYVAQLEAFRGQVHAFDSIEKAAATAIALDDKLEALGIRSRKPLYREFQMNRCMADSDASEQILPNGRLTRCEHFDENDTYGSIYDDERDAAHLQSWREWEYFPDCEDCETYPLCFNLKRCEWTQRGCQRASRLQTRRNMQREMVLVYREKKAEETK